MRSILVILYIVCFGCYLLFTRQPDYFDSAKTVGTIVVKNDTLVVQFDHENTTMFAKVEYSFMYKAGERKAVIYEISDPSKAMLYSVFGYWIRFGELIASVVIVLVLYYVAVSITSNPTPEALIEELEMGKKKPKKPKYD